MKKLQLSTRLKILLVFVCFAPLVFLFLYINYDDIVNPKSSREVYLSFKVEIECFGKIDSIYRQKMNHNILVLRIKDCVFDVAPNWETKFQVGDSISKKKGELIVEHYRNGKLIEVLDYRDIAKHFK